MDGPDFLRVGLDARWVTMYPRNLPDLTPNEHSARLSFMLYFLEGGEGLLQVRYVVFRFQGFNWHVVDIDLHGSPDLVCEHHVHQPMIGLPRVL